MTKVERKLYVFGGHFFDGEKQKFVYLNDMHILDLDLGVWIQPCIIGVPPTP